MVAGSPLDPTWQQPAITVLLLLKWRLMAFLAFGFLINISQLSQVNWIKLFTVNTAALLRNIVTRSQIPYSKPSI